MLVPCRRWLGTLGVARRGRGGGGGGGGSSPLSGKSERLSLPNTLTYVPQPHRSGLVLLYATIWHWLGTYFLAGQDPRAGRMPSGSEESDDEERIGQIDHQPVINRHRSGAGQASLCAARRLPVMSRLLSQHWAPPHLHNLGYAFDRMQTLECCLQVTQRAAARAKKVTWARNMHCDHIACMALHHGFDWCMCSL